MKAARRNLGDNLLPRVALLLAAALAPTPVPINAEPRAPEQSTLVHDRAAAVPYQALRDALQEAIEERGLVVTYVAHTQAMLARTAGVVTRPATQFRTAETLLFCQAETTHALLANSTGNIVLCPYAITVYALRGEPGAAHLAFRPPPKGADWRALAELLETIVQRAIVLARENAD